MTKQNNEKKSNARRKLIPAIGMLTVSAMMLSSATYAWFTMSREVEVTGIKMTASVPEDLQISLGTLGSYASSTYTAETSENGVSLVNSTGVLIPAATKTNASNGDVMAPSHTWDWSNSADISKYYEFGRLIPASSTTGVNIYYTPDANGVGKTVSAEGSYYQASAGLTAYGTSPSKNASTAALTYEEANDYKTSARATLHAFTVENGDTWKAGATADTDYTQAVNWQTTKDDGYYVDIPIWIRSSSNVAVPISVDGYVLPGSADSTNGSTATQLELYKAVRVAILNGETVTPDDPNTTGAVATTIGTAANATGNILPLKDAWDTTQGIANGKYTSVVAKADKFSASNLSILDSANLGTTGRVFYDSTPAAITYDSDKLYGVSASATAASTAADTVTKYYAGTYAEYTAYDPTNATPATKTIATIEGSTTGGEYGTAKKLIIRVWLDGEDGECWNDNAGQDWAISLRFSKIES